ncbi:MAG TPA: hypothetical protein VGJ33_18735 [Candidatus Angelobacter sp.]|jgi:hypothetical protein
MTMQISSKELIAGQPATKVRLLLRHIQMHDAVTAKFIAEVMDMDDSRARSFTRNLEKLGFIEKLSAEEERKLAKAYGTRYLWYRHTHHGLSLAFASAAPRIKRSTAEAIIAGFMDRVRQVNESEEYCYRISVVVLYGSVLTGRLQLGDVDFGIHVTPRLSDAQAFHQLLQDRIHDALDRGRVFRNLTHEFMWPKLEIQMFLRARKRSISIHELAELAGLAHKNALQYRVLLGDKEAIRELLGENATAV